MGDVEKRKRPESLFAVSRHSVVDRSMRPAGVTHGAVGPRPISLPISSHYRLLIQAHGLHSRNHLCGIIPALLKYK
jgi:hypothetical protein